MKKALFLIMIAAAVFISSCHKQSSNLSSGSSWTINDTTYNADSCIASLATAGSVSQLFLNTKSVLNTKNFNDNSLLSIQFGTPTIASGTYALVNDTFIYNNNLSSNQAFVSVSIGFSAYEGYTSTGTGSIFVTVSSTGKVSVSSATGIEMLKTGNPNDSTKLVFNVVQSN